LALDCLHRASLRDLVLDLGDARIVRSLLAGVVADAQQHEQVYAALGVKDAAALHEATNGLPAEVASSLRALLTLYGGVEVIAVAREVLPARELLRAALADLEALAAHAARAHPDVKVGFDLADIGGNGYYSGARFAVYANGWPDAIARGGRYDEVGAVFGRNRPAVGLGLDLKTVANLAPGPRPHAAVRAPWSEDVTLRQAVRRLREQGDSVVCILPGHEHEGQEFDCDRELVLVGSDWVVRAL
jgi:ATP phosphoribosyltransferase regulatory subunit